MKKILLRLRLLFGEKVNVYVVQSSWVRFTSGYKTIEGIFSDNATACLERDKLEDGVSSNHVGYIKVRTEVILITLNQPIDIDKYLKPTSSKK